ncbi:hypothetical protein [Micromonospora cremea]|uniref:Uncharacterized protein n=1 Tax=Micromonospora cremea TaxID=709881 RepID=A0A1N5WPF9_9ACTN|nr:hypothetical protein [Micromonospora cremea]SIM87046.1 hypothetical protein SAMN04489832_2640 [Micromonospora cremea]
MTNHLDPAHPQPAGKLVYGHARLHDCLAFADADTAAEEAREIATIASAATWGEARRVATRYTWNPVGPEYHDPDEGPADDEPFDITEVGGVKDGDWPPMVTTRALTLLPKDLQAAFSDPTETALNGYYLEIPLRHESDLVAQLREHGFEISRDDDLINLLDGRSFQ